MNPRWLSEDQRRVLRSVIADHPDATFQRAARIFEDRTGRVISDTTVRRCWHLGYRIRPGNNHLTDAGRALLIGLIERAEPGTPCHAIARSFLEETGGTISVKSVWHYRNRVLATSARGNGPAPR